MEWRECEHEEQDIVALNHPTTIHALKNCGLYKFFTIPGMKTQLNLLEWMVGKWNIQEECFVVGEHRLVIDADDIYFLSRLPRCGVEINLYGHRHGGETNATYLQQHCT